MKNQKKFAVMPITETRTVGLKKVPVYSFSELSADVQQELIDGFDVAGLSDDFFYNAIDLTIDDIKEDILNKYGLPVDIIYDLSYCQGSGATFVTGMMTGDELEAFIKKAFPQFVKSFRFSEVLFPRFCESVEIEFNQGQCASYNVLYYESDFYWESDFAPDCTPYIDNYLTGKLYELEKALEDFSNLLSGEIASRLYDEYEWYTSDENIKEILSDDLYFEDGTVVE